MEPNEILTALGCLTGAGLLGLLAIWASRWGTPRPPAPKTSPLPPITIQMPNMGMGAPWQFNSYDTMGDIASFLAGKNVPAPAPASPGRTEASRRSPARPAGFISDVLVPFFQALISGIFPAIAIAAITAANKGDWVLAFLITFSIIDCVVWFIGWWEHGRLLWLIEKMTHIDIDGDGNKGKPPTVEHEFTITDKRQGHATIWRTKWPGDYAMLRNFAAHWVDGRPFSEREATAAGYTQFEALRDMFLLNNWAHWNNPRAHTQGVELDEVGRQMLEQMASTPIDSD